MPCAAVKVAGGLRSARISAGLDARARATATRVLAASGVFGMLESFSVRPGASTICAISFIRIFPIQLSRKHNVFQHIEHGHQIVVLKNKADFPAAKYGQFLLFHCI